MKDTVISFRPDAQEQAAIDMIMDYLREHTPHGVHLTVSAAVAYAVIQAAASIKQERDST